MNGRWEFLWSVWGLYLWSWQEEVEKWRNKKKGDLYSHE